MFVVWGPLGDPVGPLLGRLGGLLGRLEATVGRLGALLGPLGALLGRLSNLWPMEQSCGAHKKAQERTRAHRIAWNWRRWAHINIKRICSIIRVGEIKGLEGIPLRD